MTRSKSALGRGGEPELRSVGLKATLPRMQVLEIFRQSDSRHLHAEDVFRLLAERRAEVGLATVYRVLSQLGPQACCCARPSKAARRCSSSTKARTMTT
jgi:Fur family ferric uptake transcriptional regulator